jgi:hypothetical protein
MKIQRLLLAAAVLLLAALPAVAAPAPATQAHAATAQLASPPALDGFLAALAQPAPQSAASCGPNFCTQAQRTACSQQCISQGHKFFVGLECCSNCTTLCICGSVPVAC